MKHLRESGLTPGNLTEINRQRRLAGKPMLNRVGFNAALEAHRADDHGPNVQQYLLGYIIASGMMTEHSSAHTTPTDLPNHDDGPVSGGDVGGISFGTPAESTAPGMTGTAGGGGDPGSAGGGAGGE